MKERLYERHCRRQCEYLDDLQVKDLTRRMFVDKIPKSPDQNWRKATHASAGSPISWRHSVAQTTEERNLCSSPLARIIEEFPVGLGRSPLVQRKLSSDTNTSTRIEIINFMTVFGVLSEYVRCKVCRGNMELNIVGHVGLAFQIKLKCQKMFGVDFIGLVRFCGLIDPSCFLTRKPCNRIVKSIQQIALAIVQLSMMNMTRIKCNAEVQSRLDKKKKDVLRLLLKLNVLWRPYFTVQKIFEMHKYDFSNVNIVTKL
ncbi:hypothetical protein V1478_015269 [Vespula squamosa]|uniref:Uncharacterized protein n=1 Tax=Vespula squamosa TaxID=30214 RepID=A0ABD2A4N6_VESSQ